MKTAHGLRCSAVIAANVRAERARRGMRQNQLAQLLGTSQTTVSLIEAGQRAVSFDDLASLCLAFEVPLVRLLTGADEALLQVLGLVADGPDPDPSWLDR